MTDWQESFERARTAFREWQADEKRAKETWYRFNVKFTIPQEVAKGVTIEAVEGRYGLNVELCFSGTDEMRQRVTDFIAGMPVTARTFCRMHTVPEGGEE